MVHINIALIMSLKLPLIKLTWKCLSWKKPIISSDTRLNSLAEVFIHTWLNLMDLNKKPH